jgi:RNA polymerase sigma factor (sigma-70 family)
MDEVGETADDDLVAFIREQHPLLVRTMTVYLGSEDVAAEIAQEALARTCTDWRKVRSLDQPALWTRRVAFNLANSWFRRRRVHARVEPRLAQPAVTSSPDVATKIAVRRALASLDERSRTVLVLQHYEGRTISEIADVLRMPEGTVKSLASRAIAALRTSGLLSEGGVDDA